MKVEGFRKTLADSLRRIQTSESGNKRTVAQYVGEVNFSVLL
jgi:hypothetical protein